MQAILFIGSLIILFSIGLPVAFGMGIASAIIMVLQFGSIDFQTIAQRMVYGLNNFTLLAVPLFILTGNILNRSGITERIFSFARSIVGGMKGALGHVNVIASIIFSGMSGTAVSDAAGIGIIEIKAMTDGGYDKEFSVAITGASSIIGPIIPPSLPMIFYGVTAGVSVGALFLGGIIPGLMMGLFLMIQVYLTAKRRNYPIDVKPTLKGIVNSFRRAFFALLTPVIILGGIYSGVFTPTEAAVIAVVYSFLISVFIYRNLTLKDIIDVLRKTIEDTVVMTFIVATSFIYGYLVVLSGMPQEFAVLIFSLTNNPLYILLLLNLFLLAVGCFMEPIIAILILTPIFKPLIMAAGINPLHFGLIMVLNLMIGLLTPPFGLVLYVLARISNLKLERVILAILPFLIPLLATLFLITIFPQLVLFIPSIALKR